MPLLFLVRLSPCRSPPPSAYLHPYPTPLFSRPAYQVQETEQDVEVPQSFFTSEELSRLLDETKPEWIKASDYFTPGDGSGGKIGRGGLFVEEPVTGTRLRRLSNGKQQAAVSWRTVKSSWTSLFVGYDWGVSVTVVARCSLRIAASFFSPTCRVCDSTYGVLLISTTDACYGKVYIHAY